MTLFGYGIATEIVLRICQILFPIIVLRVIFAIFLPVTLALSANY